MGVNAVTRKPSRWMNSKPKNNNRTGLVYTTNAIASIAATQATSRPPGPATAASSSSTRLGGGGGRGGCSLEGDGAAAAAALASASNVRSLLASLRLSVASKKSAENHGRIKVSHGFSAGEWSSERSRLGARPVSEPAPPFARLTLRALDEAGAFQKGTAGGVPTFPLETTTRRRARGAKVGSLQHNGLFSHLI